MCPYVPYVVQLKSKASLSAPSLSLPLCVKKQAKQPPTPQFPPRKSLSLPYERNRIQKPISRLHSSTH